MAAEEPLRAFGDGASAGAAVAPLVLMAGTGLDVLARGAACRPAESQESVPDAASPR